MCITIRLLSEKQTVEIASDLSICSKIIRLWKHDLPEDCLKFFVPLKSLEDTNLLILTGPHRGNEEYSWKNRILTCRLF